MKNSRFLLAIGPLVIISTTVAIFEALLLVGWLSGEVSTRITLSAVLTLLFCVSYPRLEAKLEFATKWEGSGRLRVVDGLRLCSLHLVAWSIVSGAVSIIALIVIGATKVAEGIHLWQFVFLGTSIALYGACTCIEWIVECAKEAPEEIEQERGQLPRARVVRTNEQR